MKRVHLGVNIDHAATLRNARGENDPSIVEFALAVQEGGADTVTMHLREDRRHIRDLDLREIKSHIKIPINLEMALTDEMCKIALETKPATVCIVPEKREELTTEGGLDLKPKRAALKDFTADCQRAGILVFVFVEPEEENADLAKELGCAGLEAHTGTYARQFLQPTARSIQLKRLRQIAARCDDIELQFNAGHGLNFHNIAPLLEIENLQEVNIGHALIAHSLYNGIINSVAQMRDLLWRG